MQKSQHLTAQQQANPRDEQGRMKLLASIGKGSRAVIFFVMALRHLHLFEVADKQLKGLTRLSVVIFLMALFVGNIAGIVMNLSGSMGHNTKKRLKAILNLDKLVELWLLNWYVVRLTLLPSKYVPREFFVASFMHSIFFLIQCQAYTRVSW